MRPGCVPGERRRNHERRADRLGEALRRSGHEAVLDRQPRRHDLGRQPAERGQGRPGQRAGEEAVGEHGQQPALLECEREDGEHGDTAGDEARRRLVDGIRKGEDRLHDDPEISV
jgi:hypothetical protein